MDDSKVFMFPDGGTRQTSSDANSLLPLLMCNGGFGGGNNITLPLLASNGEALTALTAGLHIIVFDKQNNKLQLIV